MLVACCSLRRVLMLRWHGAMACVQIQDCGHAAVGTLLVVEWAPPECSRISIKKTGLNPASNQITSWSIQ